MRVWLAAAVVVVAVMAVATGSAIADAAQPFHVRSSCGTFGGTTLCFEAWGVDTMTTSASGNQHIVSHAHRRFTEFTNGVLTFEQRDMSHNVLMLKDGQATVENHMFVGSTTPSGLLCRFREQVIVRDGEVLHSVDDVSCS